MQIEPPGDRPLPGMADSLSKQLVQAAARKHLVAHAHAACLPMCVALGEVVPTARERAGSHSSSHVAEGDMSPRWFPFDIPCTR